MPPENFSAALRAENHPQLPGEGPKYPPQFFPDALRRGADPLCLHAHAISKKSFAQKERCQIGDPESKKRKQRFPSKGNRFLFAFARSAARNHVLDTACRRKTFFAYIPIPRDAKAVLDRKINRLDEFVNWHVVE